MPVAIVRNDTIIGWDEVTETFGIRLQGTATAQAWVTCQIKTLNTEPEQMYSLMAQASAQGIWVGMFDYVPSPNNGAIKVRAILDSEKDPAGGNPDAWYVLIVRIDNTYDFDGTVIAGTW